MEMPEGYKEFVETFQNMAIVGYPDQAADLMKEMAEALEKLTVIYWSEKDGLNSTETLRKESVFNALETLQKFKEWK